MPIYLFVFNMLSGIAPLFFKARKNANLSIPIVTFLTLFLIGSEMDPQGAQSEKAWTMPGSMLALGFQEGQAHSEGQTKYG